MFISTHPLPTVPHCILSICCPGSRNRRHKRTHTHTDTHAAFPITTSRCCVSMWLSCWSPVQTELSFEEGLGTSDQFHHSQDNYRTKCAAAPAHVYHTHKKIPQTLLNNSKHHENGLLICLYICCIVLNTMFLNWVFFYWSIFQFPWFDYNSICFVLFTPACFSC